LVADGLRRPPTAKGVGFIRLDTADGLMDIVVPPQVYAERREALRSAFIVVEGTLQKHNPNPAVVAARVASL
jgi:DNA polymerase III alpha subunit